MLLAARGGHLDEIKRLSKLGIAVNVRDENGTSPLLHAVEGGLDTTIRLLVSLGATDAPDIQGDRSIHVAAKNGKISTILLLTRQLRISCVHARNYYGDTALALAAEHGQTQALRLLAKLGADIETRDRSGLTPLYCASLNNHLETAKFLLVELYAQPDARNHHQDTPVLIAAREGHTDMVKLLVAYGANVNRRNNSGITALVCASANGRESTVRALIELGANTEGPYMPPIESLVQAGHGGVVQLLEEVKLAKHVARHGTVGEVKDMVVSGCAPSVQWAYLLDDMRADHLLKWSASYLQDSRACFTALFGTTTNEETSLLRLLLHDGLSHLPLLISTFLVHRNPRSRAMIRELARRLSGMVSLRRHPWPLGLV